MTRENSAGGTKQLGLPVFGLGAAQRLGKALCGGGGIEVVARVQLDVTILGKAISDRGARACLGSACRSLYPRRRRSDRFTSRFTTAVRWLDCLR